MRLDASALTRLERVFDLQMWAFGCDARHPDGNLFARRGMRCAPPAPGAATSSTWSELRAGLHVALCSTGVDVAREGRTLSLQRGPLERQLRGQPPAMLSELAMWILRWEAWVDAVAGATWRDEALASRRRPAPWNGAGLRSEWSRFVRDFAAT